MSIFVNVGGVDGFGFVFTDQFDDGAFVVFAAVGEPLDYADYYDDEEGDDAVVWETFLVWLGECVGGGGEKRIG